MAAKGVKKKEHERLEDSNIANVISLLNATPPITKKEACEILNISYNTTRLKAILDEYEEKKARRKKNFERVKGTSLTDTDISTIVQSFLQGHPISDISEFTFRSPSTVKTVLENIGVPERPRGDDYHKNSFLPDECVLKEPPKKGDFLWSAKYHSACEVMNVVSNSDGSISYSVYIFEPTENGRRGGFYAYQKQEELGSLKHLEKYVSLKQLTS